MSDRSGATGAGCRRQFFRVVYPAALRPRVTAGNVNFTVIDCSETGLRCRRLNSATALPDVGTDFAGVIHFTSGEQIRVEGEVVRSDGQTISVFLNHIPLPFNVIVNEQRFLRRRVLDTK